MDPRRSPEGWQRNVWALTLCVFIAFVGFQFFNPFLPLYVRELGVTDPARIALWSGLLAAVTPAISGMLAPLFGRLADRFGRKLMLIRSLAGFTVIIAVMGLVTSVEQLLVTRILQGLFAGFSPMAMAVASVSAPREKVSLAIARVQGAQLISVAVGPAIGGLVASHLGTRVAFFITAAMCALALVALIVLFQESRPRPAGAEPLRAVFHRRCAVWRHGARHERERAPRLAHDGGALPGRRADARIHAGRYDRARRDARRGLRLARDGRAVWDGGEPAAERGPGRGQPGERLFNGCGPGRDRHGGARVRRARSAATARAAADVSTWYLALR